MPRLYEDPKRGEWAIRQLRGRLSDRDFNEVHASDFWRCLRRTYLDRDPETKKPATREEIVRFATGFAIQDYFLGAEPPGAEIPDAKGRPLIFSKDGYWEDQNCLIEFKTTGAYMAKFDINALREKTEWLTRTQSYAGVFGIPVAVFLVYFLFQRDFRSFTVVYTEKEMKDGLAEAKLRGGKLWDHFEARTLPGPENRLSDEECVWCPYAVEFCPEQAKAAKRIRAEWEKQRRLKRRKT